MKTTALISPITVADDGAINAFSGASRMALEVTDPWADTNYAPKLPTGCTKARVTAHGGSLNVLASPAPGTANGRPLTNVAYDSNALFVPQGESVILDVPADWYISASRSDW